MIIQIYDLVPTYFLLKYVMLSLLARITTLYSENSDKMRNFQKCFFATFLYTFTINCVTTGARNIPIEYMFCFICSK